MEHPARVTGRFYHAFYRWNRLNSSLHHHHTCLSTIHHVPSRRLYRTSPHILEEDVLSSIIRKIPPRNHPEERQNPERRSKPARTEQEIRHEAESPREPQKKEKWSYLLERPEVSRKDVPSSTMGPWDINVRHRSTTAVILEIAVPLEAFLWLEHHYGKNLGHMIKNSARIEKDNVYEDQKTGKSLCSLLLSGSFDDVDKTRRRLLRCAEKTKEKGSIFDLEDPKELDHITKSQIGRWKTLKPQSHEEMSSGSRGYLSMIIREKFDTGIVAEFNINSFTKETALLESGLGQLIRRKVVVIGEPITITKPGFSSPVAYPVTVCGSYLQVYDVWMALSEINERQKKGTIHMSQPGGEARRTFSETTRTVLRPLSHPIVVITANSSSTEQSNSNYSASRGVTVSSFTAVTLKPLPIVSFNLKIPSRTWDALHQTKEAQIHLIAGTAEGAGLASIFTKPREKAELAFADVVKYGGQIENASESTANSPRIRHPSVLAYMGIELLQDKCIVVGDHVIVVAKVVNIHQVGDTKQEGQWEAMASQGMLTYSMQGYKSLGTSLELPETEMSLAEPIREEKIKQTESKPARSQPQTASYAELFQKSASERSDDQELLNDDASPLPFEQRDEVTFTPMPFTQKPTPKRAEQDNAKHAWGLPPSSRSFSTLSHTQALSQRRQFSTSRAYSKKNTKIDQQVADPSVRTETVKDFLGITSEFHMPPRTRFLQKQQLAADIAAIKIARRGPNMDAEEKAKLEDEIKRSETFITKALAMHASKDLRRMLNDGHVNLRIAPFLEGAVEKGMAIILDEARMAREAFEDRQIDRERYERVKAGLEETYETLNTEAQRLRDMAHELDDD